MKQIVIPYKPRELQNFLHKKCDKNRFNVIIVHRRGGKTVFSINHLIRAALMNKKPYPRYAFISPYRLQGKATAWDYLKQFSASIPDLVKALNNVDFPTFGIPTIPIRNDIL